MQVQRESQLISLFASVLNASCMTRFQTQIESELLLVEDALIILYFNCTASQHCSPVRTRNIAGYTSCYFPSIVWVSMLSSAAVSLDLQESVAVSWCWKNFLKTKSDRPLHSTLSLPYYVGCCVCLMFVAVDFQAFSTHGSVYLAVY